MHTLSWHPIATAPSSSSSVEPAADALACRLYSTEIYELRSIHETSPSRLYYNNGSKSLKSCFRLLADWFDQFVDGTSGTIGAAAGADGVIASGIEPNDGAAGCIAPKLDIGDDGVMLML